MGAMARRSVYIAYTGGTIGMRRTAAGYAPAPGYLARRLAEMDELSRPAMPRLELREYAPLLDSSDMRPADWRAIAEDLAARYDDFDGFVVLHGTDTMAYTASALSFALEGLGKPVLLTGSQIPLAEARSDARSNLVTSLLLAADSGIPEVGIYLNGRLLRGNRATKVSSTGFEAFDSPNFPDLGEVGVEIRVRRELLRPPPTTPLRLHPPRPVEVAALRLFPGITAEVLRNVLRDPMRGLVLETYGAGNAPTREPAFLEALAEASERGVVIVNCTQCLRGRVDMEGYATGRALADAGVVSGGDMTPEAALTKLSHLLGRGLGPDETRRLVGTDLRGELSA